MSEADRNYPSCQIKLPGFDDIRKPYRYNRWPDTFVDIHPDDAAEFGIESDDEVRMWSGEGVY
ncbi:MAG: hypothetical protein GY796_18345 [Chloroflexi bacterium]|nr:hypothetical protein [Chloroflexota bacterium]